MPDTEKQLQNLKQALNLKRLRQIVATEKAAARWDVDRALYDAIGEDTHTHLAVVALRKVIVESVICWRTGRDWFYKTNAQWADECRLSKYHMAKVRPLLARCGVESQLRRVTNPKTGKVIGMEKVYHFRLEPLTFCQRFAAAVGMEANALIVALLTPAAPTTAADVGTKNEPTAVRKFNLPTSEGSPHSGGDFLPDSSVSDLSSVIQQTDDASGGSTTTTEEPPIQPLTESATVEDPTLTDGVQRDFAAALAVLEKQMERGTFDTFCRDLKATHFDRDVLTITCRNTYTRDMLNHRLYREVRSVVRDIWKRPIDLNFMADDGRDEVPLFMRQTPPTLDCEDGNGPAPKDDTLRATLLEWATAQLIDPDESAAAVDAVMRDMPRWVIEDVMRRMKGKSKRAIGTNWYYFDKCIKNERVLA